MGVAVIRLGPAPLGGMNGVPRLTGGEALWEIQNKRELSDGS